MTNAGYEREMADLENDPLEAYSFNTDFWLDEHESAKFFIIKLMNTTSDEERLHLVDEAIPKIRESFVSYASLVTHYSE